MPPFLYPRERQVLEFIHQFIKRHGYAPTLQEICHGLNLSAVSTVHEHLESLRDKGFIERLDGAVRGIEIIPGTFKPQSAEGPVDLPILGFIAAGKPLEPYTDPNSYLSVSPSLLSSGKGGYILQVKGNSMIEEGILEGDYVVIQHQDDAQNGDIVVAILSNGFATLKRIFFEKERIRLQPANSQMSPIYVNEVRIQGKVVGVIRRY